MKAIFLKYMKVNWNDGWTFHFNLRFKLWYLFDRTFGKCIFLPLVLKTESDLILILTKKGEASESEGGESEAICGGRSPLGRGGAGCYNYGHGHDDDDHHDGAVLMMMMMTLINRWEAGAQRPDLTSKISFGQTKAGFHLKWEML